MFATNNFLDRHTHTRKWAKSYVKPVEHAHLEMGHTLTPHCIKIVGTDWVEVVVAEAHFIHVHVVDISFHADWQVHLWLIWVWLCVSVNQTVQPPVQNTTRKRLHNKVKAVTSHSYTYNHTFQRCRPCSEEEPPFVTEKGRY